MEASEEVLENYKGIILARFDSDQRMRRRTLRFPPEETPRHFLGGRKLPAGRPAGPVFVLRSQPPGRLRPGFDLLADLVQHVLDQRVDPDARLPVPVLARGVVVEAARPAVGRPGGGRRYSMRKSGRWRRMASSVRAARS